MAILKTRIKATMHKDGSVYYTPEAKEIESFKDWCDIDIFLNLPPIVKILTCWLWLILPFIYPIYLSLTKYLPIDADSKQLSIEEAYEIIKRAISDAEHEHWCKMMQRAVKKAHETKIQYIYR